jgi:hypothetical protein
LSPLVLGKVVIHIDDPLLIEAVPVRVKLLGQLVVTAFRDQPLGNRPAAGAVGVEQGLARVAAEAVLYCDLGG